MRVLTTSIITALALTTAHAYAGNGDLIVKGTASIGTTTPTSPLSIGDYLPGGTFLSLSGSKVQINDTPTDTATNARQATFHVINQPNVSENSGVYNWGNFAEVVIPATSFNYNSAVGARNDSLMNSTGQLLQQYGGQNFASNKSTGSVSMQMGVYGYSSNMVGGTVSTSVGGGLYSVNQTSGSITEQYGAKVLARNKTGIIGTAYGIHSGVENTVTGTITTAYGMFSQVYNPSGTVGSGYGLYLGSVQSTNKWSLYASDATAPSYFAGNVGIGTTIPAFALDVQGLVASNGAVLTSDAKFKKNLLSISNPLDKVLNLNGLSYEWKADEYKEKNFPEGRHYGVIAQEIEKILPEVVNTDAKGDKSVAYTEIIPVLIEAMKEQQNLIKEQQKLIMSQGKRISDLEEITSKLTK
jgi:Chaperone of endosialidase